MSQAERPVLRLSERDLLVAECEREMSALVAEYQRRGPDGRPVPLTREQSVAWETRLRAVMARDPRRPAAGGRDVKPASVPAPVEPPPAPVLLAIGPLLDLEKGLARLRAEVERRSGHAIDEERFERLAARLRLAVAQGVQVDFYGIDSSRAVGK